MEQRIFHGKITPAELADNLIAHFNRGNLIVQKLENGKSVSVQIKTREGSTSGGDTALGIILQPVEDGILVQVGQQAWAGIFASLGSTALSALINPWSLFHRLDDIAQDYEYTQLNEEVWIVLESNAKALGSGYNLSVRQKRIRCDYCQITNPADEPSCIACGAPLRYHNERTCPYCGFILDNKDKFCPNCNRPI